MLLNERQPNSLYSKYITDVQNNYYCYNDDKVFINDSTLKKHRRESQNDYSYRLERAFHINYFKFFINLYFKSIFNLKSPVVRDIPPKFNVSSFLTDLDLRRNGIDNIMTTAGINALIGGQSYVLVDYDDELERPFVSLFDFKEIIDWSFDKHQQYNWVIIKLLREIDDDPFAKRETEEITLLYTKELIEMYDSKGVLISKKENVLGIVPLLRVGLKDLNSDGVYEGLGRSLYDLDVELLNINNLYNQELYTNLFNILVMPLTDDRSRVKIAEDNVLQIDPDSKFTPYFLAPSNVSYAEKREYMKFLIDEMVRIAGFKGKDKYYESGKQSGISKAYDFVNVNETLSSVCRKLANYETQILYLMYLFTNPKQGVIYDDFISDVSIVYPREFDVLNISQELDTLYKIIDYDISENAVKEAKKAITRKSLVGNTSISKLKEIEKEIENQVPQVEEEPDEVIVTEEN